MPNTDPTPRIFASDDESPQARHKPKEDSRNWAKDTHRSKSTASSDRLKVSSQLAAYLPMLRHCAHHRSSSPPRPAATRVKRKMCRLVAEADLLHERDEVVHEVLLHDLAIVPEGDRAEVNFERLAGGWDLLAVGPLHRPGHGAGEVGDRAGPVPGGKEDPVGSVVEVLVRKGLPELDRLLRVVLDPVGRRLSGPAHDHVRLVTLPEDLDVLGVPGVIQRLHQLHVPFLNRHLLRLSHLSHL